MPNWRLEVAQFCMPVPAEVLYSNSKIETENNIMGIEIIPVTKNQIFSRLFIPVRWHEYWDPAANYKTKKKERKKNKKPHKEKLRLYFIKLFASNQNNYFEFLYFSFPFFQNSSNAIKAKDPKIDDNKTEKWNSWEICKTI